MKEKIIFRGKFHDTTATVLVKEDEKGRYITRGQMDSAERKLCGVKGCSCGGFCKADEPREDFYMDWNFSIYNKEEKNYKLYL